MAESTSMLWFRHSGDVFDGAGRAADRSSCNPALDLDHCEARKVFAFGQEVAKSRWNGANVAIARHLHSVYLRTLQQSVDEVLR